MSEAAPFCVHTQDYAYWVYHTPLEFTINFKNSFSIADITHDYDSQYNIFSSPFMELKAKSYVALNSSYTLNTESFEFLYTYNKKQALYIKVSANKVVISPDQTSVFPLWYAFAGKVFVCAQTYGDLLRLCKKNSVNLTLNYTNEKELEELLQNEKYVFKEVKQLYPDFRLEIDGKEVIVHKTPLNLDQLNVTFSLHDALEQICNGFCQIEDYFTTNTNSIGIALSGGKDSAIVAGLTKRYFSKASIRSYSIITDEPNLENRIMSISQKVELKNQSISLNPQGLALVDPLDPYLNPYNKITFDFAQLIAQQETVFFNGFGGNEVFGTKDEMFHDTAVSTQEMINYIEKPLMPQSLINAHVATSPYYFRFGVVPFSPFSIRQYLLSILLIDDMLKKGNLLYAQLLNKLGLSNDDCVSVRDYSLSVFFANEVSKVYTNVGKISSKEAYKQKKKLILKTFRRHLHELSMQYYNHDYEH